MESGLRRIFCSVKRSNWFLQIAEDHIPEVANTLSQTQKLFLRNLLQSIQNSTWELSSAERLDIDRALELQDMFHATRLKQGISLHDALAALYACFLDDPFTMQVGLLLIRLEPSFVKTRLNDVARENSRAA
jgi:dihydroorotase